jgi:phage repressor protein C with HTH and peptisase S24 domain
METTVKDRLKAYLSAKNISMAEFGRRIGVSGAYVTSMRKSIQPDKIEKIRIEFPDLDIDWLLTGKAKEVKQHNDIALDNAIETRPRVEQYAAGGGNEVLDGVTLGQCEQVPVVPMFPRYDFTMRITGESMMPYLHPGDEVACLMIKEPAFLQWGRIHVLATAQGIIIKKIFDAGDGIRCVSFNENYPDFIVPKSEIYSFNLVIGLIRLCN